MFSRQKQMVEKAARASRRRVEGPFSRSNLYSVIKSSLSCKKKSTEGYLSLFQTGLLRHFLPGEKHVNLQLVQKATDLETLELFPSAQSDFFCPTQSVFSRDQCWFGVISCSTC